MSSGISIITYLASEFCRKDIASLLGIVIIFSPNFISPLLWLVILQGHSLLAGVSIKKKNNVFQNTIIVLTC
jgi:hypothetical protein